MNRLINKRTPSWSRQTVLPGSGSDGGFFLLKGVFSLHSRLVQLGTGDWIREKFQLICWCPELGNCFHWFSMNWTHLEFNEWDFFGSWLFYSESDWIGLYLWSALRWYLLWFGALCHVLCLVFVFTSCLSCHQLRPPQGVGSPLSCLHSVIPLLSVYSLFMPRSSLSSIVTAVIRTMFSIVRCFSFKSPEMILFLWT